MASVTVSSVDDVRLDGACDTLADVLARLGHVDPARIRFHPPPGTATEDDVVAAECHEDRLCELIDGVMVEKVMSYRESMLALALAEFLRTFVVPRNLGIVTGADGMLRLFPGLVYIPDVAYASWDRIPGRRVPDEPIASLVPDLAVEVISPSNTAGEMDRKLRDYIAAGVRLIWFVYPQTRTVVVHQPAAPPTTLQSNNTLDGGAILPGFTLPLADLFGELDRQG